MELDDFEDFYNFYRNDVVKLPKRFIRDMNNIFELYNDDEFKKRFRFQKASVIDIIVPLIENFNNYKIPFSNRGLPLPTYLKVLIALRFYATASFQNVASDLYHVSQPAVCRIISSISHILACHIRKFVKFPSHHNDFTDIKRQFYLKYFFPGIIGLIDGTHIPIKSVGGNQAELYRNRKGYFSINVQIIGGPNEEIFDLVVRWPGSTHDFRIFENSRVRVKLCANELPGHLLGDSGYPQRSYLFTPILHPQGEAEQRYNFALIRTRSLIERIIGRWKRRFPCLYYEMQNNKKNVQRIISACAVLYNIGISAGDLWEEDNNNEIYEVPNNVLVDNARANAIRQEFIARHFS